MTREQRFESILGYFRQNVPVAESELHYNNAYELLVAVMLSAQCTDRRVNLTTPELFRAYPTVQLLAEASAEDILPYIRSISYPNSKAAHLAGMARKLVSDFNGEVPPDVDSLMSLPGVGRKTANVIAAVIFGEGVVAVDTHVFRVSNRLGLSSGKTPRAVELDLEKHIPDDIRPIAHHWLLLHGRYVCTAKNPHCEECGLKEFCRQYQSGRRLP